MLSYYTEFVDALFASCEWEGSSEQDRSGKKCLGHAFSDSPPFEPPPYMLETLMTSVTTVITCQSPASSAKMGPSRLSLHWRFGIVVAMSPKQGLPSPLESSDLSSIKQEPIVKPIVCLWQDSPALHCLSVTGTLNIVCNVKGVVQVFISKTRRVCYHVINVNFSTMFWYVMSHNHSNCIASLN